MSDHIQKAVFWGRTGKTFLALGLASYASFASASVLDRPFFNANATVVVYGASGFSDEGGISNVVVDFLQLDQGVSGQAALDLIGVDGVSVTVDGTGFIPIFSAAGGGTEFDINDPVSGGEFNSANPNQLLTEEDSYNAFELDEDTNIDLQGGNRGSRFFVASNAAFDIFAHADSLQTTGAFDALDLSNIRYRFRVQTTDPSGAERWGSRAQDPSIGGIGIILPQDPSIRLDSISSGPTKVFDGGRKTAAVPGALADQAVSFQSRYSLIGSDPNFGNYDFSFGTGSISADVTYTVYVP